VVGYRDVESTATIGSSVVEVRRPRLREVIQWSGIEPC